MKEKEKERKSLIDIDNLYDAKYAGTINSNKCHRKMKLFSQVNNKQLKK